MASSDIAAAAECALEIRVEVEQRNGVTLSDASRAYLESCCRVAFLRGATWGTEESNRAIARALPP